MRKLLPEEKKLRAWCSALEFPDVNKQQFFKDITALVRGGLTCTEKEEDEAWLRKHEASLNYPCGMAVVTWWPDGDPDEGGKMRMATGVDMHAAILAAKEGK